MPDREYIDPDTGEILAGRALGADESGPQFARLHPDLVQQAYIALGEDVADKAAAANLLEETRRSLRAKLARAFRKGGMGVGDAGDAAEASQQYTDHITAMVEARRLADRAKVRLEAFRVAWETARTVSATERNAMKM
jgi:hypothetical protein